MSNIRRAVMLSAAKHPCSLPSGTSCKDNCGDPSPARKHGGLRMTTSWNLRIRARWTRWAVGLSGVLSSSALAYAQGCAMCYTSAAASKAGALHALRTGILILLVPVLVMCAGIFVVIYRSRNRFCGAADWTDEHDWELREMLDRMNGIEGPDLRGRSLPSVVRSPFSVASRPGATDQ